MASTGYLLSLRHWIDRLGLNRDDTPPLAYGIQPVMIVSDASEMVTPLLPAMAMCGGQATAAVATHGSFSIQSRAPGGTWVHHLYVSSTAAATFGYEINATPTVMSTTLSPILQQMGPTDVNAVVRIGDVAAPANVLHPTIRTPGNGSFVRRTPEMIYIPPGSEFIVIMETTAGDVVFSAQIADVPSIIPDG